MKCPKCNCKRLELMEFGMICGNSGIVSNNTYTQTSSTVDSISDSSCNYSASHVEAYCPKCRHQWKVRGMCQIPLDGEKL
jgi:Zn-finger nucleic acid-binding protein